MALDNQFDKDPFARLDYSVRWVDWLGSDQITGSSYNIVSNPDGMLVIDTATFTTGTTTIWISSGTINHTYRVENPIGTLLGRSDNRSILIEVKDK